MDSGKLEKKNTKYTHILLGVGGGRRGVCPWGEPGSNDWSCDLGNDGRTSGWRRSRTWVHQPGISLGTPAWYLPGHTRLVPLRAHASLVHSLGTPAWYPWFHQPGTPGYTSMVPPRAHTPTWYLPGYPSRVHPRVNTSLLPPWVHQPGTSLGTPA